MGQGLDVKRIREDFPALHRQGSHGRLPIYFDNAAGTIPPRQVIAAVSEYFEQYPSCVGRSRHWWANEVKEKVRAARLALARFIHAPGAQQAAGDDLHDLEWPQHLVFVKNTTEGLNLIARGLFWEEGEVVITGDREHNSNRTPWWDLAKTRGIQPKVIKRGASDAPDAEFDPDYFLHELEQIDRNVGPVKLVSLAQTYNLDGYTIADAAIQTIAAYCHSRDPLIYVMLDAAQSVPHIPVDVQALDIDFMAFSIHKMLGPTGLGVCYLKDPTCLTEGFFPSGGGTVTRTFDDQVPIYADSPARYEAGLQHWSGIIGAGAAVAYLRDKIQRVHPHQAELNRIVTEALWEYCATGLITLLGPRDVNTRSSICTFEVPVRASEDPWKLEDEILGLCSEANIMFRTGDFCVHPYCIPRNAARIRLSFYLYNTPEECHTFVDIIRPYLEMRR
ncbi:MAG: aminotransferase class V-fold PLP-dependent enzyme [Nitrospinae bacterium]|nr:aminotransferase class V-fold PLP-dependent enzyme [Nitrospinota bacterium]